MKDNQPTNRRETAYDRDRSRRTTTTCVSLRAMMLVAVMALGGFASPSAWALGFRIPNQDAEAIAKGNAFAATADNPSALYYNPAGITQLPGHHIQFGLHALSIKSTYDAPGGAGRSKTQQYIAPVPQIYYTLTPEDSQLSYGLGVYSPFGLEIQWPQDSGFRTLAIEGKLIYATVAPTVAWKINSQLSAGAALNLNYGKAMFRRGIVFPTASDEYRFEGDDTDLGYSLGLLWQPHEKWSFGVKYQHSTSMNFSGSAEARPFVAGRFPASVRIPFPLVISGGVSFRPTPKWNIEFNADWTDWNRLTTPIIDQDTIGDAPFPFNWDSSFLYHVGATRTIRERWFVGAGYFFSENSTTDRDFNPLVPDTNLHVGSLGGGFKGSRWNWAVTGQVITGPDRTISGHPSPAINGSSFHWLNYAINFSLGRRF